jgi:pyruvate kinase
MYDEIFAALLAMGHVNVGDRVLVTKGELSGIAGRTNSMQILSVTGP